MQIATAGAQPPRNLAKDVLSGFIVFLLALPLSIGIAMASGFPPLSGLIAAAIGGVLVAPFSGSPMSIKGPAAGMIVIMLGAVEELGAGDPGSGVRFTLAAVVLVGLIQIVLGKFKVAELGKAFPESTVKGMLAAIGVIIISKQFHVMMGHIPASKTPIGLLREIPDAITHCNPEVALVGLCALLFMSIWPVVTRAKPLRSLAKLPIPLVVIVVAVISSLAFDFSHAHQYAFFGSVFDLGPKFLVNVPTKLSSAFIAPDYSRAGTLLWWKWVFMIGAVGSLESVLAVKAVDALDPLKRRSDCSKDLMAVGFGNTISGLVGGLPMIAEIVRSSANLNAGAQSRWSNFFHGLFIVVFVALCPWMINLIPLSALAGLLVFTGFRLASPSRCRDVLFAGKEQFAVFLVTLIVTLSTDLLMGIGVGLLGELMVNFLASGTLKHSFRPSIELKTENEKLKENFVTTIGVNSQLTFTNLMSTIDTINKVQGGTIVVDLSKARFVDHTSMSALAELQENFADRSMELIGFDHHHRLSRHPHGALLSKTSTIGRSIRNLRAKRSNNETVATHLNHDPFSDDTRSAGAPEYSDRRG